MLFSCWWATTEKQKLRSTASKCNSVENVRLKRRNNNNNKKNGSFFVSTCTYVCVGLYVYNHAVFSWCAPVFIYRLYLSSWMCLCAQQYHAPASGHCVVWRAPQAPHRWALQSWGWGCTQSFLGWWSHLVAAQRACGVRVESTRCCPARCTLLIHHSAAGSPHDAALEPTAQIQQCLKGFDSKSAFHTFYITSYSGTLKVLKLFGQDYFSK